MTAIAAAAIGDTGRAMSADEDVEVVRRAFEAWNEGDVERVIEMAHADLEFVPLRSQLDGAAYHGGEGMRQFARDAGEEWEYLRILPDEFRAVGGEVLMLGRYDAKGRGSGMDIQFPCGWVARVRDGKLAYLRTYSDPQEALKAVGLDG